METSVEELRCKEVICLADGCRLGYVGDMEVDLSDGRIKALLIPGRRRLFGLLGREPDRRIPWSCVHRFGDDIILVETCEQPLSL